MKQIIVTALAAIMAAGAIQAQARDREEAIVTKITDGAINLSRFSSGAPFLSADELTIVFTSDRQDPKGIKPSGNENIYMAHRPTVYQPFTDVRLLSRLLNKKSHYGVLGQTVDGLKYFVYDGSNNNIYVLEGALSGRQKLTDIGKYYGIKINRRYDIFSCAISADEDVFYICQAAPGGKGGVDIWLSRCYGKGKWSKFTNLEAVNTEKHEITVSVAVDGDRSGMYGRKEFLYFSSNGNYAGQPALGGYDIYRYDIDSGKVKHVGAPINTPRNDVYYTAVPSFPDHAYYSSERAEESGAYDIYFVDYESARDSITRAREKKRLEDEQAERERVLAEAAEARRHADSVVASTSDVLKTASKRERELLAQQQERERQLKAEQQESEQRLRAEQQERERQLAQEQAAREQALMDAARRREDSVARAAASAVEDRYAAALAAKGYKDMNLISKPMPGDKIYLKNILFEKGKSKLAPSSYPVLDELYDFLMKFPSTIIEIGGHTSSEGSYEVNMRLSRERALAVKNYLVKKGIYVERLQSKGYAYTVPIEDESTEFGRILNRRVEASIIK
jgi:outer membrane protein OmpA-like peptidoglycan-associated protein